jgi:hypothetical protein
MLNLTRGASIILTMSDDHILENKLLCHAIDAIRIASKRVTKQIPRGAIYGRNKQSRLDAGEALYFRVVVPLVKATALQAFVVW